MRIALVGFDSFIARHVADAGRRLGLDILPVAFDDPLVSSLRGTDAVINFTLNPRFFAQSYDTAIDCDRRTAIAAAEAGARFTMLSSRKAYRQQELWGVREDASHDGDGSHYGSNKAASECVVLEVTGGKCIILRLSNIFGFEYRKNGTRKNFFGQLLRSLREEGEIRYDMNPASRRDFLPVEFCAEGILRATCAGIEGTFNLGSGFPSACGEIADWVMEGFGGGHLVVTGNDIRDEFFLNVDKWNSFFSPVITREQLKAACIGVGRKLKDA